MASGIFTPDEYQTRISAVQTSLSNRGLDGIVVADPANIYYLTGYNAWSFYMPQVFYVPVSGEPRLIMREMDARGAHRTAVVAYETIEGYPESYIHQDDRHPGEWIGEKLRELGYVTGAKMRVAYEEDAHFFSVRTFLSLQQVLPEWELVPGRELVNWVRVIKSDAEIAVMRKAAKITDAVMNLTIDELRVGRPLNEIAGEVQRLQAYGVGDVDGDYPAIVPMFPRGEGADTPHLTWTADRIGANEAVSIELAGVHHRYHAPLARTVSLGTPNPELDRVAKVTVEAFQEAITHLKTGNTPADVAHAWDTVLAKNGLEKKSRLGYSIGVGFPPDWGEHTVSLRADDTTELKQNMTFHMITGMWMTGFGFECSESVRVTDNGPDILTSVPRELFVKEV